ncbi:MAG: ABC transporter permease, partial [Bacteroidota bacterium]
MLKNYFKIAWANIRKNAAVSLINIFGLALGISLCLVLISIIKDQSSFDTFHPDRDRIFRINTEAIRKDGGTERYASAPFPLGKEVEANYPFVEKVVQLSDRTRENVSIDKKQLTLEGFFAGPEFFEVFGFDLLYGDKETALAESGTIVISQKASEKFFGNENPFGKILTLEGLDVFK